MSNSNVKVENLSSSKVKLTISVTAEQFDEALNKAFTKVVKDVKVDGFRQGHVPLNIFIKKYGWESLYQDGLEFAFQATYYTAVNEAGVYPVSDPKIDLDFSKIAKGQGFEYTAELEVWPEPVLGEYKGLKVKPKSTKVTKTMVNEYITNALKSKAEIIIKETPAENGDTVVIDFEGFVAGEAFEGGKAENYPLELGSNSFIPGFEEQLIGVKTGDEVDVNVVFPENYHEALAGKPAVFKVKVHEVKGKTIPKLTDDVVAELEVENVKTKAEYESYVKDLLTNEKEHEAENYLMDTLMKKIIKNSTIEVPQAVIDAEVSKQVERITQQAKSYNIPVESLLQYSGYPSMDAFKENGAVYIKRQITEEIVIDEIIKKENFVVTPEEIEAEYAKLVKTEDGDTAETTAKKLREVKEKYQSEQIEHHIKMVKAVQTIKDNAVSE